MEINPATKLQNRSIYSLFRPFITRVSTTCADESYAVGKGRLIIIPRQVAPISPLIYIYDRVSEKERIDQSI